MGFCERLGLTMPLIQAPMAGVSSPAMAAAVSEAGGLGSIGIGGTDAAGAQTMIAQLRAGTTRAFNVNLFVHPRAQPDPVREAAWIERLGPLFAEFGAEPPPRLRAIYPSFLEERAMQELLLELAPPVISFHFGLPPADLIAAFRARGCMLLATATNPNEARTVEAAGLDAIVAQGIEAGGHRGMFDPDAPDSALGLGALTRMLVRGSRVPVIASGGIMDGAGIAAALALGAVAAQLGTAFIACPESLADAGYRAALFGPGAAQTTMTTLISGRPARSLPNRFTALVNDLGEVRPPVYPVAYDAGKALHAAAKAHGEYGFGAQWAGQGAPLARAMPAGALVAALRAELESCLRAG